MKIRTAAGLLSLLLISAAGAGGGGSAPIEAAATALKPILARLEPAAKTEIGDNGRALTISYLPQKFQVHGISLDGQISPTAHEEIGPSYKGFILNAYLQPRGEVNMAVTPQTLHRPYWLTDLDVTPVGKSDNQLYWSVSYGSRTDRQVLDEIRKKMRGLAE